MNKRISDKINARAEKKIREGEPLTQMESMVFVAKMEKWFGPEIVKKIKGMK